MTQYVIDIGAAANDGTGDPLRTAFNETNLNFDQVFAAGPVLSNVRIANNSILTLNTNGNLILAPNGIGRIQANATIVPSVANVRNLGSSDRRWSTVYTQYLDLSGSLTTGDLTVDGNLTVQGNIIQVGNIVTETLTIQLANAASTANAANGSGITVGANDNIATLIYNSTGNVWTTNIGISSVGNITAPYFFGNGSQLTGLAATYGNANVVTLLSGFGSNTVSTTGNITAGNLLAPGAVIATNFQGGNLQVTGNANASYIYAQGSISTAGFISAVGNITANVGSFFIGNGSQLTGLAATYGNANVVANLAALGSNPVSTTGNVVGAYIKGNGSELTSLPAPVVTQDITSNGAMSIMTYDGNIKYVNYATVEPSSGNIAGGNITTTGLVSATGNITGNYFIGNGSQLTGISSGIQSSIANGTSNVNIATANGNATITANAASTWTFGTDSTLTLPAGSSRITSYGQITIETDNNASGMYLNADGVNLLYANANVTLRANSIGTNKDWNFGNTGVLTLPNADATGFGNIYFEENSSTITFGLDDNATPYLYSFSTSGITLPKGGVVSEGAAPTGIGNTIAITPSGGSDADQQLLVYPTGNIVEGNHLHLTTGDLYNTELFLGNDNLYVKLANTGNVVVNSNDDTGNSAQWTFGTDGNLTLPGNIIAINYANGNRVTGGVTFNGEAVIGTGTSNTQSGLYLAPDPVSLTNDLYLRVRGNIIDEPTHIHFDTGNNQYFNQFIGDDNKYIQLANTGNIVINTSDYAGNTAQWMFDTNSTLTLPGGSRIRPLGANLDIFAGTGSYVNLITADESSSVGVDNGGGYITTAGGTWDFGTTGNLTAPGNISAVGNVTAGNISAGSGTITGGNVNGANFNGNVAFGTGTVGGSGNITGGNILTAGIVSATGNVSGNYFIGNGRQLTSVSTSFENEIHVAQNGNDTSGDGTINYPYRTIQKGVDISANPLTDRRTVVIHPGTYIENVTVTFNNTQIITYDLTGASTTVSGTLTLANNAQRLAGLKITNLTIAGNTQAYINSCTVTGQLTKSSSGYVEIVDVDMSVSGNVQITGGGTTLIDSNKIVNLRVANASASVSLRNVNQVYSPEVTAGTLSMFNCFVQASGSTANAITASAGTVLQLFNTTIYNLGLTAPARISVGGFYQLSDTQYDRANSVLGTSLGAISFFQSANIDSVTVNTTVLATGNITGGNILTGGLISATGNVSGGNLNVTGNIVDTGALSIITGSNGNIALAPNGTGIVTASSNLSVTGNISANNLALAGNITSSIGFTGATITINNAPGGNEGAEVIWALPSPANTVLSTSLVQDVYQNGMRFFESGGNSRGLYMDLGSVPNGSSTAVGYRDIPQVSFTANTTIATTDAGRHYYSTQSTSYILTIANNASQSFQVGAAISIVNQGTGNITVAQGSGVTLYLAGNATSGNRTVATFGMATLIKVATDTWFINGTGVT